MVLDTSAIVAAVANEPNHERFREAMRNATSLTMSSISVLETRIVLHGRYGPAAVHEFDAVLCSFSIVVVAFDATLAGVAFDALCRYGKGQGHPAQLNIVDCATYALAKSRGEPLLFKGQDFANTDIVPAL